MCDEDVCNNEPGRLRLCGTSCMNVPDIPFNQFLGIRTARSGVLSLGIGRLALALEPLGHGPCRAQMALAEATSGQCLLAALPELEGQAVAVVRRVEAKFKSPMKGAIFSRAVTAASEIRTSAEPLSTKGRAIIPVTVEIVDRSGAVGLVATFEWFAQKLPAETGEERRRAT